MQVKPKAEYELNEQSVRKETGKTLPEWFAILDQFGGIAKGRKGLGDHLLKDHGINSWWATTLVVEYEAAREAVEKDGKPRGYAICVTKTVKASAEKAFDAFAAAGQLDRWLGPQTQIDFQQSGRLSNGDGNQILFAKISPGKVIRFTWEDSERGAAEPVEVKFQPQGAKCGIVLTHERIVGREAADGLRRAWGEAFERLKAMLEA